MLINNRKNKLCIYDLIHNDKTYKQIILLKQQHLNQTSGFKMLFKKKLNPCF